METLIRALQRADRVRDADVILLVRGGGSLEDLIAFNSESLARAIRATRLPVVTGVGHETDTTVADLAADRRAATPSAAAELVAPSVAVLREDVAARSARLGIAIGGLVKVRRDRVHIASLRLRQALMQETSLKRRALDHQTSRFAVAHPSRRVEIERLRLQPSVRASPGGDRPGHRGAPRGADDAHGAAGGAVAATDPGARLLDHLRRRRARAHRRRRGAGRGAPAHRPSPRERWRAPWIESDADSQPAKRTDVRSRAGHRTTDDTRIRRRTASRR